MKFELLTEKFREELNAISLKNLTMLDQANRSILLCRRYLAALRKEIINSDFDSVRDEIDFFKKTKHVPFTQHIYFSKIRSFELHYPKANIYEQKKFTEKKLKKLNNFFLLNIDFGQYIEMKCTHFDEYYFTRKSNDQLPSTPSKFYYQDPEFSTPKDMLLAQFKAFGLLVIDLEKRLVGFGNSLNGKKMTIDSQRKLSWPFTNTDWVELIYALCSAGLSKKNGLSIIKVSNMLQEVFDFTPKEIYKTYQDIKARKQSRILFLDELSTSLLSEMDKSEE